MESTYRFSPDGRWALQPRYRPLFLGAILRSSFSSSRTKTSVFGTTYPLARELERMVRYLAISDNRSLLFYVVGAPKSHWELRWPGCILAQYNCTMQSHKAIHLMRSARGHPHETIRMIQSAWCDSTTATSFTTAIKATIGTTATMTTTITTATAEFRNSWWHKISEVGVPTSRSWRVAHLCLKAQRSAHICLQVWRLAHLHLKVHRSAHHLKINIHTSQGSAHLQPYGHNAILQQQRAAWQLKSRIFCKGAEWRKQLVD